MKVAKIRSLCAVVGLSMLVLGLALAEVQAQPPGGGGGPGRRGPGGPSMMGGRGMMGGPGMMGGMNVPRLVMIDQVQKEIGVTEDQAKQLEGLREEMGRGRGRGRQGGGDRDAMRQRWEELRQLPEDQRREKMRELMQERQKEAEKQNKETMEKLAKILKPEQLMRAKQIQMQLEGVGVLRRPEVQEKLGLDDAQKKELQKVQEEAFNQMRERMQSRRDQGREGDGGERRRPSREDMEQMREQMENARKEIEKKVMAVLTADQKKELGEMMGKPFELDRSALRPPRREGRGGEDRPQGDRDRGERRDRGGRGGRRGNRAGRE